MSGGTFDYKQSHIRDIAEHLEEMLQSGDLTKGLEQKTLDEFKKGLLILRKAHVYAQRIDWLLAGDDGEDTFHQRLRDELTRIAQDPTDAKPELSFRS